MVSSECRIVPFTKPPCSVVLLGEPGLTKSPQRRLAGLQVRPGAQARAPSVRRPAGFSWCQFPGVTGLRTAPLPEDVGLQPPGFLVSSGSSVLLTVGPDGAGKHSPLLQHHPHPLLPSPSQFCSKHLKNLSAQNRAGGVLLSSV